ILSDYNYWGNFKKELLKRAKYENTLDRNLSAKVIAIVKGARRSGKSSMVLKYLDDKNIGKEALIINLEDPRLPVSLDSGRLMEALDAYLTSIDPEGPKIVVVDEAQHANGWERFTRYLVETKGIKCIVTGSSAALLSEEYATAVTGRHLDITMFPFSFEEFVRLKGIGVSGEIEIIKKRFEIKHALDMYVRFGGFPEIALSGDERVKIELLRSYFNDILVKDIMKRYRIKMPDKLEAVAKDFLANIANVVSLRNVSRSYGVSLQTVERFAGYFSNAYLFFYLKKFSPSKRKQENSPSKVYVIDNGFYTAMGFKEMEHFDKLMENLVAIKLISNASLNNSELYYWQDYAQREVDFVIKESDSIKRLIQVTYASSEKEVKGREIKNLERAAKELKCRDLLLITWDYEGKIKQNGKTINAIPLWKWLLQ
ncbi:MAG: ATP-binding protein, partial [Candidatus Micrarchaeaceae archaeon]